MAHTAGSPGPGAGAFAGGGLIALYAVGCLLACVIVAISGAVAARLGSVQADVHEVKEKAHR